VELADLAAALEVADRFLMELKIKHEELKMPE